MGGTSEGEPLRWVERQRTVV